MKHDNALIWVHSLGLYLNLWFKPTTFNLLLEALAQITAYWHVISCIILWIALIVFLLGCRWLFSLDRRVPTMSSMTPMKSYTIFRSAGQAKPPCSFWYNPTLSLSRVLDTTRSWCIASFAIIVGSYDVSPPLPSCNGLSFPLKLSYRIESLRIWEHLMYVLPGLSVVTMGYSRDPLDVCFSDQLAGFVTLGIYA